ncbi:MAG: hypothetical protein ONB55_12810 [candidate division KSB1 bacterium]|nr:hypothetical protein [candidate division KSB1 bacterium]
MPPASGTAMFEREFGMLACYSLEERPCSQNNFSHSARSQARLFSNEEDTLAAKFARLPRASQLLSHENGLPRNGFFRGISIFFRGGIFGVGLDIEG